MVAEASVVGVPDDKWGERPLATVVVMEGESLEVDELRDYLAGLGVTESARMVTLLKELRREVTIVLVEHDMEAVFALADRLTVLVYGRIIASGDPEAVRADATVRQAYLGEKDGARQGVRHG